MKKYSIVVLNLRRLKKKNILNPFEIPQYEYVAESMNYCYSLDRDYVKDDIVLLRKKIMRGSGYYTHEYPRLKYGIILKEENFILENINNLIDLDDRKNYLIINKVSDCNTLQFDSSKLDYSDCTYFHMDNKYEYVIK